MKKEVLEAINKTAHETQQMVQESKTKVLKKTKRMYTRLKRLFDNKLQELSYAAEGHHNEQMGAINAINNSLNPLPPQGLFAILTGKAQLSIRGKIIWLACFFLVALLFHACLGPEWVAAAFTIYRIIVAAF